MTDLVTFWWLRPRGSFKVQSSNELLVHRGRTLPRRSEPLRESAGLFRTFAALHARDNRAVADFASKHGPLWLPIPIDLASVDRNSIDAEVLVSYYLTRKVIPGGYLTEWRDEIERLHDVVSLWDAIRSGDTRYLEKRFRLHDADVEVVDVDGRKKLGTWPIDGIVKIYDGFGESDVRVLAAHEYIRRAMNTRLATLRVEFVHAVSEQLPAPRGVWDVLPMRIMIQPQDLASAMWVQFAESIQGDRRFALCDQCEEWYLIQSARKRRYCSDACSSKAKRERRKNRT